MLCVKKNKIKNFDNKKKRYCHDVIIIVLILSCRQFRKYSFVKSIVFKS